MTDALDDGEWVLFQYSGDPFVNEGAVEIGRRLNTHGIARITKRFVIATAPPEKLFPKLRAELFGTDGVTSNTHRRTTRAYQVNALANGTLPEGESDDVTPDWLGEREGQISIPAPTGPFPNVDEDATVFEENELTDEALEEFNLDPSRLGSTSNTSAYSLHPANVGPPGPKGFFDTQKRAKAYFDSFEEVLLSDDEHHSATTCMSCGSSLPNWDWKPEDGKKVKLETGQGFTPVSGKSSQRYPLGQRKGLQSYERGRCPACLIAGYYYTLMPMKPVADAGGRGEYRIHCVKGDFKAVRAVRRAYDQVAAFSDLATPTDSGTIRNSSIPVRSTVNEMQSLAFYGQLVKALSETPIENEKSLFADGGDASPALSASVNFHSIPTKGSGVVRNMEDFRDAPISGELYDRLTERTRETDDGIRSYSPYSDVIDWYVNIRQPTSDGELGVELKRDLARGIFTGDLSLIEKAIFGLLKKLAGDASAAYRMTPSRHRHYFSTIMNDMATNIDDEVQDTIKNAGRSIGGMFAEDGDIDVLQAFKHANTPDQFLKALERAGMSASKRVHDSGETAIRNTWVANSTAADLIGAISDEDTFEAAKQMFVIHASLSAHYRNSTATDDDGDQ